MSGELTTLEVAQAAERGDVITLVAEIDRLRADGTPGVMHAIDKAFYDAAVGQRDRAWQQIETLEAQRDALRDALTAEPTDAEVEAGARALWLRWGVSGAPDDGNRQDVRAILAAAREARGEQP